MLKLLKKLFLGNAANQVAKFLAIKAILITLTMVVLPIILFNFKIEIAEYAFTFITSFVDIETPSISFSGIGGWLVDVFNLIPIFTLLIVAYIDRLILKLLTNVF